MKKLLYIGNKLSGHGITVTSIETLGQFLEDEGYTIYYASSKINKAMRLGEMIWSTLKYAKRVDYVLIDTYSTYNFWYAFAVSQICRIIGAKYIPKLHGGGLPGRLKKNPRLCRMIFRNAYRNVAPSDYLLRAFEGKGFAEVVYIPNTIELGNYPFVERPVLFPKLLWVRTLSPIYNPEMALRVLEGLKVYYPSASLCMVGPDKDGKLSELRETSAEKGLGVAFTGKLSKEEWTSLSQDYSIFINTTHFDNTPVSVIEAMALGLPVVSTNVGGIPFLLRDRVTGMLVDDDDDDKMVLAIRQLLEAPELKNRIVANAFSLVQEFDWKQVKNKWERILA